MWAESQEQRRPLRTGLTTGCCATACCVGAARALLAARLSPSNTIDSSKAQPQSSVNVSVQLPGGSSVTLHLSNVQANDRSATAETIKDAGDDPDVTHGAKVFVELKCIPEKAVLFRAAEGVGVVTRPGLPVPVGEPAINPVPRKMMREHLQHLAEQSGYQGGFEVAVGIENGSLLAQKTMNPRLGIVGGLSILGTTGIVRPYSCSAYVASIHQGVDVACASDVRHLAAVTGSNSESAIRKHYQLPDLAIIEMGDLVGALLKYVKRTPVSKLTICGGFGKISKLANGYLDLHSRASSINFRHLAKLASESGAPEQLTERVRLSNTSSEALSYCQEASIDLAGGVCRAALRQAKKRVPSTIELEILSVDRQGHVVGQARESESS